jgi:hypothetical protein
MNWACAWDCTNPGSAARVFNLVCLFSISDHLNGKARSHSSVNNNSSVGGLIISERENLCKYTL